MKFNNEVVPMIDTLHFVRTYIIKNQGEIMLSKETQLLYIIEITLV